MDSNQDAQNKTDHQPNMNDQLNDQSNQQPSTNFQTEAAGFDGVAVKTTPSNSSEKDTSNESEEKPESVSREIWEWVKAILVAIVLVVLIHKFLMSPYLVSGQSMMPTFHDRERMIVNKLIYSFRNPVQGEVIVFNNYDGRDLIKRVIATEGQTIKVEGDKVFIADACEYGAVECTLKFVQIEEPYLAEVLSQRGPNDPPYNDRDAGPIKVPMGHVFVMGENRSDSLDSRAPEVGPISMDQIVGRSDLVYWPISHFHIVDHPKLEPKQK